MDHVPPAAAEAVPGLIAAIDARDGVTARHGVEVGRLARAVALELGWTARDAAGALVAGLVHDIGRIALPDAVLAAPGRLDAGQWVLMRTHPERGARLLDDLGVDAQVVAAVRAHHERWDGSGYAVGLRATEIPRMARLVGLCEAHDAMTAPRPAGRAKPSAVARDELALEAGILFDPEMVEALLDVAAAAPRGPGDFGAAWRAATGGGSPATPGADAGDPKRFVPRTQVDQP